MNTRAFCSQHSVHTSAHTSVFAQASPEFGNPNIKEVGGRGGMGGGRAPRNSTGSACAGIASFGQGSHTHASTLGHRAFAMLAGVRATRSRTVGVAAWAAAAWAAAALLATRGEAAAWELAVVASEAAEIGRASGPVVVA